MGDDVAVPRPSARRVATSLRHGSDHVLTAYFFSLILIQKLAERSADGYDYRTLLLQRHATKGSFRSAHVFPGGNIDDADHDPYWRSNASSSDEQEHRPFKVCAVRETFEECGLLAATRNDSLSAEDRTAWRKKVHAKATEFSRLCDLPEIGGPPSFDDLVYRGRFVTPRTLSKRWDTYFYITLLPQVSSTLASTTSSSVTPASTTATSDGVETVSADWFTPLAAVQRALLPKDDPAHIIFAPPQFYYLAELVRTKSWKDLVDSRTGRPRARKVVPFEPEITVIQMSSSQGDDSEGVSSFATVYPGDPNHSSTPSMTPRPSPNIVHRTYVDPPRRGGGAPALTIKGVRRKGMAELWGEGWEDLQAGETFEPKAAALQSKM